MTDQSEKAYSFTFKGLLTEEALDAAGRKALTDHEQNTAEIYDLVALSSLDETHVAHAKAMSIVYTAIAAFENSIRELISHTLKENVGENWWAKCTSEKIQTAAQKRKEEEEKIK